MLRVSSEDGIEAAATPQGFAREEALLRECPVKRQAAVSLAQDEPVTIGPTGVAGINPEDLVVEDPEDLHDRES